VLKGRRNIDLASEIRAFMEDEDDKMVIAGFNDLIIEIAKCDSFQ